MKKRPTTGQRAPLWALLLIAKVCADHGRRAPVVQWWRSRVSSSSGHCCVGQARIHVTAGTDVTDQQLVLMHELAHYVTPHRRRRGRQYHHSRRFWNKAFELYAQYGDADFVEYARSRESEFRRSHPISGYYKEAS